MSAVMEAYEPSAEYLSTLQLPLVQHFELMATAPGGVAKLRELILTLAVQGKLVPQDRKDEPASALLRQIREEKDRLIAEGKVKREKALPAITEKEEPFALPSGWEWVRLGTLLPFRIGKTPPSKDPQYWGDEGHAWVSISDMTHFGDVFDTSRKITAKGANVFGYEPLPAGTLIMSFKLTKISVLRVPAYHNEAIVSLMPLAGLRTDFLKYMLPTVSKTGASKDALMGATLNTESLSNLLIALPPLAEQSRIVTRVQELMRLCDALEAKGQLEAAQHTQLVHTLLGALTTSASPEELADNWHCVANHFDLLLDRPEAIDALEQTILQLAVRGLVTEQLPSDGKAGDILLNPPDLPEGTKRRRKILRRTRDTGIESDLPGVPLSWEWISIQDLYDLNVIVDYADGNHGSLYPRSDEFGPDGVTFVSAKDIAGGGIKWETCSKLNEQRAAQLNKGWANGGDVLLTHNATVGRVAMVEVDAAPFLLGTSVTFYRTNACALDPSYLFFAFMSPIWQNQLKGVMEQTTRNQVSIQKQAELLVPLPPLAEQLRIVARVESLRRLCADLRQRLAARQTTQAHLAKALIDEVA